MPQRHRFVTRPLFLQVRDELASKIAGGTWKAGAMLPNEIQLASEFGVSQGTMRKALDLLEAERIVTRQAGRGTMVVDHDTDEMAIRFSSVFNSFEQRISGHITSSEAEFDEPAESELEIFGEGIGRIARAFRVRAYHDHPFMVERVSLALKFFKGFELSEFRNARLTAIAQRHGLVLSAAKERVVPVLCPEDKLEQLGLDSPVPILHLHRVTFNDRNEAVELRIAWCHLRDKHYTSLTS